VLPVLKAVWLASDQLCSKLLKAALPQWLNHYQRRGAPLPQALKKKLFAISPAQIDRFLRPARVQHQKKGLSATRPGTLLPTRSGPPDTTRPGSVEADTVAHCDDSTEGDYVHSLTFTELHSGWTENRAVWNKSADAVLVQVRELEPVVPYAMKDFHTDNGGEVLNWALHRPTDGAGSAAALDAQPGLSQERQRPLRTEELDARATTLRARALRASRTGAADERLVCPGVEPMDQPLQADLQTAEAGAAGGKTRRIYEPPPQTPYQRLLASPDIPEATKAKLRTSHASLDPFALRKNIEGQTEEVFHGA
jgi:hypothetical protein